MNDGVYIIFEKQFEERLNEHLRRFLRLSSVRLEKVNMRVAHVMGRGWGEHWMVINQRAGFLALSDSFDFPDEEMPEEVYTALRVENNISVQGIDFDREMLLNTNWQDAVSFTKGCYLGQEIMGRVRNLGRPPKKLVRVLCDRPPEKITSRGEEVGRPTSVCYSPTYRKYIAFSLLPHRIETIDQGEMLE